MPGQPPKCSWPGGTPSQGLGFRGRPAGSSGNQVAVPGVSGRSGPVNLRKSSHPRWEPGFGPGRPRQIRVGPAADVQLAGRDSDCGWGRPWSTGGLGQEAGSGPRQPRQLRVWVAADVQPPRPESVSGRGLCGRPAGPAWTQAPVPGGCSSLGTSGGLVGLRLSYRAAVFEQLARPGPSRLPRLAGATPGRAAAEVQPAQRNSILYPGGGVDQPAWPGLAWTQVVLSGGRGNSAWWSP